MPALRTRSAEPTVGPPNQDETGIPDLALMVTDLMVAFDHLRHEITLLANVLVEGDRSGAGRARPLAHGDDLERSYEQAAAAIADMRERLAGPVPLSKVEEVTPWIVLS